MNDNKVSPKNPHLAPAPKRRRWLTVLLFLAVFIFGIICGAGITLGYVLKQVQELTRSPDAGIERGARWLTRRLDLTPEQEKQVHDILRKQVQEISTLREDIMPRVREQVDQTEDKIADVLTPEQQKKWRDLAARLRRRWMPGTIGGQGQGQQAPRRLQ